MQLTLTTSGSTKKDEHPIYLWPKGADLSKVKAAVLSLNLPFKVSPFWFKPGAHGKVIALEPGFTHIVDHLEPLNEKTMAIAVQWALGLTEVPQVKTVDQKLKNVFGQDLTEVHIESPWDVADGTPVHKANEWLL